MTRNTETLAALYEIMTKLESAEECRLFFDDLFTAGELGSIAQRLEVARLLRDGKKFSDIVAETGASTATISRVNRCLQYGGGGYAAMLDKK